MSEIDWSKAPEGYDYWIVDLYGIAIPDFHCIDGDRYYDDRGEYYQKGVGSFRVIKRPENIVSQEDFDACYKEVGEFEFRPIRTEEEKAVDEMLSIWHTTSGMPNFCKALYKAGYRKVE